MIRRARYEAWRAYGVREKYYQLAATALPPRTVRCHDKGSMHCPPFIGGITITDPLDGERPDDATDVVRPGPIGWTLPIQSNRALGQRICRYSLLNVRRRPATV
ncbi:hypothetical protein D9M72_360250 [compost metagenome]